MTESSPGDCRYAEQAPASESEPALLPDSDLRQGPPPQSGWSEIRARPALPRVPPRQIPTAAASAAARASPAPGKHPEMSRPVSRRADRPEARLHGSPPAKRSCSELDSAPTSTAHTRQYDLRPGRIPIPTSRRPHMQKGGATAYRSCPPSTAQILAVSSLTCSRVRLNPVSYSPTLRLPICCTNLSRLPTF